MSTVAHKITTAPQFANILFTTDLSPCSELALPYARAIARLYGSTIHLLHVTGPEAWVGPLGVPYPHVQDEDLAAQRAMNKLMKSGALEGTLCTRTIMRGEVWGVVSNMLTYRNIDLIVLGTHGYGGLRHVLLGSVAEQIFRHASCPVMTVGPRTKDGLVKGHLEAIIYATDFSGTSLGALPYALSLARANRAKLKVVHAIHPIITAEDVMISHMNELIQNAKQQALRLVEGEPDLDYQVIVQAGTPSEMILEIASHTKTDLIVMGAHRGTSSHTPWAVAHRVVCQATCPVLTVRG